MSARTVAPNRVAIFIQEYLKDSNGKRAALVAGYSARRANRAAHELLKRPVVAAEVARRREGLATKAGVTAEQVRRELALLAFANMHDFLRIDATGDVHVDFSQLTRDQAAAIGEFTIEEYLDGKGEEKRPVKRTKFKLHDKLPALVHLGKDLGLFQDTTKHVGVDGGPLKHVVEVIFVEPPRRVSAKVVTSSAVAVPP